VTNLQKMQLSAKSPVTGHKARAIVSMFLPRVNTRVELLLLTCRVMCRHEDWIEGLHIGNAGHDATDQRVFSFSADGHVCMWELDAEQNCDVYRVVVSCLCQETHQVSTD
jgi:hypothetical protein